MNKLNIINKKSFILHHLGLGDMITMNGAVRYISQYYDEIYLVCKPHYLNNVIPMYSDNPKIKLISIEHEQFYTFNPYRQNAINNLKQQGFDIYLSGSYAKNNLSDLFFIDFYHHLNLDFSIKTQYQHLNRNLDIEQKLYDKIITNNDIKDYIFLHTDSSTNTIQILNEYLSNDAIFVFNPNRNFYESVPNHKFYYIWKDTYSELINYSLLIENTKELHLIDSAFYCLANLLDLSNIQVKKVYLKNSSSSYIYRYYDNGNFQSVFI